MPEYLIFNTWNLRKTIYEPGLVKNRNSDFDGTCSIRATALKCPSPLPSLFFRHLWGPKDRKKYGGPGWERRPPPTPGRWTINDVSQVLLLDIPAPMRVLIYPGNMTRFKRCHAFVSR